MAAERESFGVWSCSRQSGALHAWRQGDGMARVTAARCTLAHPGALLELYGGRRLLALIESPATAACAIAVVDATADARPELMRFPAPETLLCVAATPDSRLILAGASSGRCYAWEGSTGVLLRVWDAHIGAVRAVCVLRDGSSLITAGDDALVHVWAISDACALRVTEMTTESAISASRPLQAWRTLDGHALSVRALSTGLAGPHATVLSGSDDGSVRLWSLLDGNDARTFTLPASVSALVFAEHTAVAFAGLADGSIARIDFTRASANSKPRVVSGHAARITCMRLSPDFCALVTSSEDGTVRCWDFVTLVLLSTYDKHAGTTVDAIAVVPVFHKTSPATHFAPLSALQHTLFDEDDHLTAPVYRPAMQGELPDVTCSSEHASVARAPSTSATLKAITFALNAATRRDSSTYASANAFETSTAPHYAARIAQLEHRVLELECENAELCEASAELYDAAVAAQIP
mmetsp:Transcript_11200/g.30138  ORF Transcript_11200/g.30138 Transcript_11200/m.30138 type:complete len:466 (-) Transcript_11200:422-1819(-)